MQCGSVCSILHKRHFIASFQFRVTITYIDIHRLCCAKKKKKNWAWNIPWLKYNCIIVVDAINYYVRCHKGTIIICNKAQWEYNYPIKHVLSLFFFFLKRVCLFYKYNELIIIISEHWKSKVSWITSLSYTHWLQIDFFR